MALPLTFFEGLTSWSRLYIALVPILLYLAGCIIYNLYFHPLAKYPGPLLWRASRWSFVISLARGNQVRDVLKIHQQYGDIVRLAPNELSFAKEDAWHEVFATRPGHKTILKNPLYFKAPPGQPENLVTTTNEADSSRMRKVLAPGFTKRALTKQEPMIQSYINLLMAKLKEAAIEYTEQGAVMDMSIWYNFFTFDVIGELVIGESFGCLDSSENHPWVAMTLKFGKAFILIAITRYYPPIEVAVMKLIPASLRKVLQDHYHHAVSRIHRRMNLETPRDDLMTPVLQEKDFTTMSLEEIESTFSILLVVGSETTVNSLTSTTNSLVQNPRELRKLIDEVRSTFESTSEITFDAVKNLPFLNAVVDEGLRLTVAGGIPRMIPQGGETVCGHFLPEYTHVTVSTIAIARSPANFVEPDSFLPDRFLPDSLRPAKFANDNRGTQKPFGLGPRNCMGMHLARAELRTVLARMVWEFDLEEVPGHRLDWIKQKVYLNVQREPMLVRLRLREQEKA